MKVGIIGAGIGGIATAIRMASRGHQVHVVEANSYPGGKLSELHINGYRFDAGPSLFTMPNYVEELFKVAGIDIKKHFEYERLDIICNYFWEDQTRLTAFADAQQFAQEVEKQLDVSKKVVLKALASSEKKYQLTGKTFLEYPLQKASTWLTKDVAKALVQLPSLDIFKTMHQVNERDLKHPKLVQLFDRYATYNGSNPYKAPGILNIIPHYEYHFGAYFPKGGMYAITTALVNLAKQKGVQFLFNKRVNKIVVENRTASGIEIDGQRIDFDLVVSNMDVFHSFKKLLVDQQQPERILNQQKSTSALIFYWGIKQQFPELDLHNIFFSEDYKTEFEHLEKGSIYDDPTVYINISQKHQTSDAPNNCENWFTMINVPYNSGQDWDSLIQEARKNILTKVSRILKTDIEPLIACQAILDPRSIEQKTSSHLGALYGTSSNDRMAAFLRHPNFSNKIKNLYFCGGSVHPGGGVPLCLLSAKIIDQLVHES